MKIQRGDTALVTGASRGLGVHIARALAQRGMNLVLAARSAAALETTAQEFRGLGVEVLTVPTDVGDADATAALVAAAMQRFGRIDVLVNNAGIDTPLAFDQRTVAEIGETVQINLVAPIVLCRQVLPHMLRAGRGHIVNVASIAGIMSSPYEDLYVATKHGLVGFTRSLRLSAQDLKWPISASALCPGFMDDAGMFEMMKQNHGAKAPRAVGSMKAEVLGPATIRAIENDLPDVLVMKGAPRISAALQVLLPRLYEIITKRIDAGAPFRVSAAGNAAARQGRN